MPKQKWCNAIANQKGTPAKSSYFSQSDELSGSFLELEMENWNIVSFTTHLELDSNVFVFLNYR